MCKMRAPKFNVCVNLPRSDVLTFRVYILAIWVSMYTSYMCINTIFSLFTSFCLFAIGEDLKRACRAEGL